MSRAWGVLALCLGVAVFLVNLTLARNLERTGVFAQYNVLFDTDASARLGCFSSGWGGDCRSLVHPNLANLVNPPIRVAERLAGVGGGEEADTVRRAAALAVAPLGAAAQSSVLLLLLGSLGLRPVAASLLALLGAVSFSQVLFGSVPEHFVLSGLALSLGFLLAVQQAGSASVAWVRWCVLGVVVAGITITNVLPFLLLFGGALWAAGYARRALARAVLTLGAAIAGLTLFIAVPMNALYGDGFSLDLSKPAAQSGEGLNAWMERYLHGDALGTWAQFPVDVAAAVVAPHPIEMPNYLAIANNDRYKMAFTFAGERGYLEKVVGGALFLAVMVGAWYGWLRGGVNRMVVLLALAVLGFNGALHALWGTEYFLYSQHWNIATLVLLGGIFLQGADSRRNLAVFGLLVGLVAVNTTARMQEIMAALA